MIADSSLLFALYFRAQSSPVAQSLMESAAFRVTVSKFQVVEFRSAVAFEVWRRRTGDPRGMNLLTAQNGLAHFELDLERDRWATCAPAYELIMSEAERLTDRYTASRGLRLTDAIHIATANVVRAGGLLTLDVLQREVAVAEGLHVLP